MDDIDVFDDVPDGPNEDGLSRLSRLFHKRMELHQRKEALAADLLVATEELREIEEKQFPDLFDEVGVASFEVVTDDGKRVKVSVEEKLYGSLPSKAEERAAALAVVHELDGDGILKTEVKIVYPKGEADKATALRTMLLESGVPAELTEGIHPSTYVAWAKEQQAGGRLSPSQFETLGIWVRRFVKVK